MTQTLSEATLHQDTMSWLRPKKLPPLVGTPDEVIDALCSRVEYCGNQTFVWQFYIGRSSQIEARQRTHDSDDYAVLYETESFEDAMEVEGRLISAFQGHFKYNNRGLSSGGGRSNRTPNLIYIAWWWPRADGIPRRRTDPRPDDHPVNDWVNRYHG